jgi:SAM-dependent methyltransferase
VKTEYDAFAASYDLEYGTTRVDLAFYVGLATAARPPVLELACGTGRVTLLIAQAGVPITGVDSSQEMLARARAKVDAAGTLPVTLVEGDMRTFQLDERFGLAIIPARSFLHLLTPEDHVAALRNVRAHLLDGGRLALNFFVPDLRTIVEHAESTLGQSLSYSHKFDDPETGQEVLVWRSLQHETYRQRIYAHFVYEWVDEAGATVARRHKHYTLCYIHRNEMEHLLARCGFKVEALYGDFEGAPFDAESTEMVWVATREPAPVSGAPPTPRRVRAPGPDPQVWRTDGRRARCVGPGWPTARGGSLRRLL